MIREERVVGIAFDAASDTLLLRVEAAPAGAGGGTEAAVELLLDAKGHLVGVDLGGDGLARQVAMLGPHESVASVRPGRARVARDGGALLGVVVLNARRTARGDEPNPYLR